MRMWIIIGALIVVEGLNSSHHWGSFGYIIAFIGIMGGAMDLIEFWEESNERR